jgi:hypothetical protein
MNRKKITGAYPRQPPIVKEAIPLTKLNIMTEKGTNINL